MNREDEFKKKLNGQDLDSILDTPLSKEDTFGSNKQSTKKDEGGHLPHDEYLLEEEIVNLDPSIFKGDKGYPLEHEEERPMHEEEVGEDNDSREYYPEERDPRFSNFSGKENKFQSNKKTIIKTASIIGILAFGFLLYMFIFPAIKGEQGDNPTTHEGKNPNIVDVEGKLTSLLEHMYNVNNIDEIALANNELMATLSEELQEQNDIRAIENYDKRYGMFSNEPTTVTVKEVYTKGNTTILFYTVNSEVAPPLDRVLVADYSEFEQVFTRFEEMNIY